jgi:EAL domain-containing protein (putative c-di-GMP-specific phosphodiesterase class I)
VGRELDPVLARVVLASSSLPVSLHAELRASDVWRAMRGAVLPWLVAALAIALGATLLIDQRLAARGSPERRMLRAMRKRQFEPVAQPIVSLATGECVGAEVLMRWAHPVRGLLPPAEFIALAEESGMIVPMSEILMRKARDQLAPLARRYPHLYFSFNVTSAQLRDPAFPAKARAIFDEVSLPPRAVLLELIEREAVDRQGELALAQLRSLGFRLAMDDFGTGESSLASLQALAFDRIKVDREFVRTIDEHSRRRPVLDTVIRLGHDLGVPLIAEGVETRAQWDYLSARGVQAVQGFLVARPMPIDAFGRWLDEHARKAPSVAGSDDGEGAALDAGPQIERDALAHG